MIFPILTHHHWDHYSISFCLIVISFFDNEKLGSQYYKYYNVFYLFLKTYYTCAVISDLLTLPPVKNIFNNESTRLCACVFLFNPMISSQNIIFQIYLSQLLSSLHPSVQLLVRFIYHSLHSILSSCDILFDF